MTKQRLDRIGGLASILTGGVCLWLGLGDWERGQSLWKVWVVMCVILVLNGIAMMWYARHSQQAHPAATGRDAAADPVAAESAVGGGSRRI